MKLIDNDYPRYSSTFGCMVRDRHHLRELEQRYNVSLCTQNDLERKVSRQQSRDEEAERSLAEVDDEYRNSSGYAEYRRAIACGAATQHLPPERQERARQQLYDKYCK